MKTIKVISDFGITEAKTIGKPKTLFGEQWVLVEYPCKYMNAKEPVFIRKIVHIKTGMALPIFNMHYKAPQKDFFNEAYNLLTKIGEQAIHNEVSKYNILN